MSELNQAAEECREQIEKLSKFTTAERVTSRLSLVIGAALVISVTILAVGYFTLAKDRVSARAKKSTHPLDWLLWFGGAKEDQTFEKFVKDSTKKSQKEWEERYRNSPAYQFNPEGVDFKRIQWKLEPNGPLFKKPPGR